MRATNKSKQGNGRQREATGEALEATGGHVRKREATREATRGNEGNAGGNMGGNWRQREATLGNKIWQITLSGSLTKNARTPYK